MFRKLKLDFQRHDYGQISLAESALGTQCREIARCSDMDARKRLDELEAIIGQLEARLEDAIKSEVISIKDFATGPDLSIQNTGHIFTP